MITAPASLPASDGRPRVFLGGSIDMGTAPDWQKQVIAQLSTTNAVVLNPRRADWSASIRPDADDPQFREQVEWELGALETADVIVLHLASGFKSPVALLELGLHARSGRILLFCEEGFWRKGNVDLVAQRYDIREVSTLAEMADAIRDMFERLGPRRIGDCL